MTKKKSKWRATRFHSKWRADADFKSKLSPEDRQFYDKFEAEYYRNEFGEDPVHPPDALVEYETDRGVKQGTYKQEAYYRQNRANSDSVTQTSEVVTEHLSKPIKKQLCPGRHSYYAPEDYPFFESHQTPGDIEDCLIEAIDATRENQKR